jgi:hypothetical protein
VDRGQPILPTGETGSLAIIGMASMLVVAVVLIVSLWFTLGKAAPAAPSNAVRPASSQRASTQSVASTVPYGLVAACESDAKTLDIAVAAAMAENPARFPTTSAAWHSGLLSVALTGGPFLQEWPTKNDYYAISVAGNGATRDSGDHARPGDGDVLVTVASGERTFDFTAHPATACMSLPTP